MYGNDCLLPHTNLELLSGECTSNWRFHLGGGRQAVLIGEAEEAVR